MRVFIIAILFLNLFPVAVSAQSWDRFPFQSGDLLFQDLDCGELCDAIEAVTPSLNGKRFSHIGMVYIAGDSVYIIEAMGKDVHLTPMRQFILRQLDTSGRPKVIVGRLREAFRRLNSRALGFALLQRGKPYDEAFIFDNGQYYCSELVYEAYKAANDDRPFFNLYPMTFIDPATNKTFPAWKNYYKKLGTKIPEGRLGCNPGSIALSDQVEIIGSFY